MYLILSGFLLLFFKVNFTLFDDSLIYILSNILGYILIRLGIEKSEDADEIDMKDSLWFYVTMNLIPLLCVVFGVSVESISLDYIDSYLLAATVIFAHVYLFVYPLYLFSNYIGYLESQSKCMQSKKIQLLLRVCFLLVIIITFGSSVLSNLHYLWVMVIGLQLYAVFLFRKKSRFTNLINVIEKSLNDKEHL